MAAMAKAQGLVEDVGNQQGLRLSPQQREHGGQVGVEGRHAGHQEEVAPLAASGNRGMPAENHPKKGQKTGRKWWNLPITVVDLT